MADFRRWILAFAALVLVLGSAVPASAQAGLNCTASAAVTPTLRHEGFTELTGDILLNCVGAPGSAPTEWSDDQVRAQLAGLRYGDLKKQVAEMVVSKLEPIQRRYCEITEDPGYLDRVLREGAEAVTPIADSTVELVKRQIRLAHLTDALLRAERRGS